MINIENKNDEVNLKDGIDGLMHAVKEYQTTNDKRLDEIEKKGVADPLTVEKLEKMELTLAGYEGMNAKITKAEKSAEALKELSTTIEGLQTAIKRTNAGESLEHKVSRVGEWARAVYGATAKGEMNLPDDQRTVLNDIATEWKALNVTTDTAGGYLAPKEFVQEIIKGETAISPVRSLARVRQTSNKSVQIPTRTGQFAAAWVLEQGTKAETAGLAYGIAEIATHEFYALVDISNQMIEDSEFNMEQEIAGESAEQFGVAEGKAFISGTGTGQPTGLLVATGVPNTDTGVAATVSADSLLTVKHALKTAYARNASYLMNRTTLGSIRKLKDTQNQYLWAPGLASGKPNTIDGDPYVEMSDMPIEAAAAKPVIYGDFRRAYVWVDRISMEMLRDPYTQATTGNVRFVMRKRVGGNVVLAEAIRTLTCKA